MHFAAQRGNIAVLEFLLNLPFDTEVNCRDAFGRTALHYATESKRTQAIGLLISHGANIDATDYEGRHAIHYAAAKNNLSAIECIVGFAGNDIVQKIDNYGGTPAQLAHSRGAFKVSTYLTNIVQESTNLDTFDREVVGTTPWVAVAARLHRYSVVLSILILAILSWVSNCLLALLKKKWEIRDLITI